MKTLFVKVEGGTGSGKTRFLEELRERFKNLYKISEVFETEPGKEWVKLTRKEGK